MIMLNSPSLTPVRIVVAIHHPRPFFKIVCFQEEHDLFLEGMKVHGRRWTKVADIVGTRTTVQVGVDMIRKYYGLVCSFQS
jgi:hypothetical protein